MLTIYLRPDDVVVNYTQLISSPNQTIGICTHEPRSVHFIC